MPISTVATVYQTSAKVKIARRPKRSANGLSRLAPKQTQEGRRRERRLIGETEHTLIAGGEDPVTDQPGADVGRLEQIVEFEETANRQQRHQSPDRGDGGQAVDASGNLGGAYRIDAVALRGGGA
jgi:hypothetical protein